MEMCGPEIRSELDEVNIVQSLNGLKLEHYLVTNDQIQASSAHWYALEADIYRKLRLERDAAVGQRHPHGRMIDRFQKTRS